MALLDNDIQIFIWRAAARTGVLGSDILTKESKGFDISSDIRLIEKLCASIQVLQNPPDSMTSNDKQKLMSYMYGLGELLELPIPSYDNLGSITNIIQGAYFIQGPKGDKGDKGDTGATGATGATGPAGTDGTDGYNGWTPVPAIVSDGERRVMKVIDWTGGTGTKPSINVYVYTGGFTTNISLATDIRGAIGATGAQGQQGPAGANGASAYIYVGYASDASGTDFSLSPSSLLEWIAFKPSAVQIPSPSASDFTGLWIKYKGEKGDAFTFNAIGPGSSISTYDNEDTGFTFLDEDTGEWYIKRTSATADWAGPFELGPQGWSPELAVATDGDRRVFQLVAWVGGQGVAPTDHIGDYLTASGFDPDISLAIDVRGPQGERFFPDAQGTLAGRTSYDTELEGFIYYATDNGEVYIKLSDTSGDWSVGYQWRGATGSTGPAGSPGNGFTEDVSWATTANLSATYNSGAKTLTATSNGVFTVDGLTPGVNTRGLVKDQTTGSDRGIYIVTDPGSVSTPYVLTRASDFDTTLEAQKFIAVFVTGGTTNRGTEWTMTTTRSTLVLDTTTLSFSSINGISGGGGTFLPLAGGTMTGDIGITTGVKIKNASNPSNYILISGTSFDINSTSDFSITATGYNMSFDAVAFSFSNGGIYADAEISTGNYFEIRNGVHTIQMVSPALTGDRIFTLSDYDLSAPTSAPSANTAWGYNGSSYTWLTVSSSTGTVTSVSAGTGMSFTTINTTGSVDIDTAKVPYYSGGFSTGLAKYNGSSWVFDTSSYFVLPSLTSGSVLFSNGTTISQDNSNFFYDSTNHRLGLGITSPASILHISENNNSTVRGLVMDNSYAGTSSAKYYTRKSRTGGVITTGDILGNWTAAGHDGTNYVDAGDIRILSTGTISTGIVPGQIIFRTANTSGTLTQALLIDKDQSATFGGNISFSTVTSGTWNGSLITGTYGGTGVNNGSKTITLGGNLTTTGAFNLTIAVPQTTTYTLPNTASETLAGIGTAQTWTAAQKFASGTVSAPGIAIGSSANGIYSDASNQYKFASNGANKMTINTTGVTIASHLTIQDTQNVSFATGTGTKFGITTGQKFAFWNKTPIVQPTTGITGATRVGGGGTTITDTDTFGGYTIAQIAAGLINVGLLA